MTNGNNIPSEIIEAATTLFQYYGYDKTSMEDISKSLGKGKSTLYHYFPSKEKVFEAVVNKEINEFHTDVRFEIRQESSAVEKLRKYLSFYYKKLRTRVILYEMVCGKLKENSKAIVIKMRLQFDYYEVEYLKNLLQYGIDSNEIPNLIMYDVNQLARIMISAFRGIEIDLLAKSSKFDVDNNIDISIEMLIRGINSTTLVELP